MMGLPVLYGTISHGIVFDIVGKGMAHSFRIEFTIKTALRLAQHSK